jgi:hypothetical protein
MNDKYREVGYSECSGSGISIRRAMIDRESETITFLKEQQSRFNKDLIEPPTIKEVEKTPALEAPKALSASQRAAVSFLKELKNIQNEDDKWDAARLDLAKTFLMQYAAEGVQALRDVLSDTDDDTACSAIELLSQIDQPVTRSARLELFQNLLNDSDSGFRTSAVLALVHFASDLDAKSINNMLDQEHNAMVKEAYRCLLNEIKVKHRAMAHQTS